MIECTKKQLGEMLTKRLGKSLEYSTVAGLVDLMIATGQGTEIGNEVRPTGTKGKPSKVYRLNSQFSLLLDETSVAFEAKPTETVEEVKVAA